MLLRDGRTLIGYLRSIDQFGRTPLHAFSQVKVPGGAGAATHAPNVLDTLSAFCPPANLVFHQTVERIHVGKKFGDIPRGIFIVRGENVVLLGEIVSRTHAHAHACRRIVLTGDTLGLLSSPLFMWLLLLMLLLSGLFVWEVDGD